MRPTSYDVPDKVVPENAIPRDVEHLTLDGDVEDLSGLAGLTSLRSLKVQHAPSLRDLRPIGRLPGLRVLSLNGSRVDLAGLRGSPLEELDVYRLEPGAPEDFFAPLGEVRALRRLHATASWTARLDGLARHGSLRDLSLALTSEFTEHVPGLPAPRVDLRPLEGLTLEKLELSIPPETDLRPLGRLARHPLRLGLRLSDDAATAPDLSPLGALSGVQELRLTSFHSTRLECLAGMRGLRALDALLCPALEDVRDLAGAPDLEQVLLCVRTLRDLAPLASLARLRTLVLRQSVGYVPSENTPVPRDLSSLAGLGALETLTLVGVELASLDFALRLPRLRALTHDGGRLGGDPGVLASASSLRTLSLVETRVAAGWSWLARLGQLEKLTVSDWVPAAAVEAFRRASPKTELEGYTMGDPWGN